MKGDLPPTKKKQPLAFDLIVANILKNALFEFAHLFKSHLKINGRLVLSGILEDQEKAVLLQYKSYGLMLDKKLSSNGWVTLLLK